MNEHANLVSKVLVLDSDADCYAAIKSFCDENNLVGLKVQDGHALQVLESKVDLGAILLSENYSGSSDGGIVLAREIHRSRPELPIFLRRESKTSLDDLCEKDQPLFSTAYTIDKIDDLRKSIDASIFCQVYPNALVRGITELTTTAMTSQFKGLNVEVEAPYIVRDRIIFGELFTMIPLESNWCRGYMTLQAEERSLLQLVKNDKANISAASAADFRNLNNLFGEITNLIWGSFKNRFVSASSSKVCLTQVPIIINHLHRYISFGSEDPQLCFKYTLTDRADSTARPLVIYQRFVFNLNWSPEEFNENLISVEELVESGELELF